MKFMKLIYLAKRKSWFLLSLIFIMWILFTNSILMYSQNSYSFIKQDKIMDHLLLEKVHNSSSEPLPVCDYDVVLMDQSILLPMMADADLPPGHGVRTGGEYTPADCNPSFSSAIIVPYRNHAEHLRGFLVYMHTFLRRQQLHYKIFVVEQVDTLNFNPAKLLNIGAKAAIKAGFPCLILHDIDLLPLKSANIYACSKQPRHMSCSIDSHRFILKHPEVFGGAIAISSRQFLGVNGLSNSCAWSPDDEHLFHRLKTHKFDITRFEPETCQYHLFYHKPKKNRNYCSIAASDPTTADGLRTLKYSEVATVLHPLFTHIMVDLASVHSK